MAEAMKAGSGAGVCPDLEMIAAYLDDRLSARDRADVTAHIASCETCYFVFTEAAQMRAADAAAVPEPEPKPKSVEPRAGWWATPKIAWSSAVGLAAAACLTLAVGTGLLPFGASESSELRALVTAVGNERPIEARLTGGFAHGPMRSVVRGADVLTPNVSPDVRIAAAQLEKAVGDDTSANALRDRAIAALVTGDVDRAVATLEQAAAKRASDARIQSDLAAAYLARASQSSSTDDLSKALAAANRAVNLQRTLPEALFNRASAMERLRMTADAEAAWQAYLTIDDRSGWSDEARTHLRTLGERR